MKNMWISQAEREYQAGQQRAWERFKREHGGGKGKKKRRKKGTLHRKAKLRRERERARERCMEYLKKFWPIWNLATTKEQRLELCRQAAKLNWWVSENLRAKLRHEYSKIKHKLLAVPIELCGICQEKPPREKHHIVMIAFGGQNVNDNMLAICLDCHALIHPWLKAE